MTRPEDLKAGAISCLPAYQVNAPAFYRDPDFVTWLNSRGVATWHDGDNPPGEFSDVFTVVDCLQEGPDRDAMPEPVWDALIAALREAGAPDRDQILVWITNLEED
jgi:hypothetical protein